MPDSPLATALAVLDMARAGRFTEMHEQFTAQLRSMVPAKAVQASWHAAVAQHGAVVSAGSPVSEPAGPGGVAVKVPVVFEHGELTLVVVVTGPGSIAGLQLAPTGASGPAADWQPPPYADPGAFAEQDVTVGAGPLAVTGTLTVPRREAGPVPGVVLLPGSGPQDRDGTIGPNKPLKDLAWGLASRGVAALRFDKVTCAHASALAGMRDFTLTDEYVPQAVAAIGQLRDHPAVDATRVFVAGHSLGGTVAPRVAVAEPAVAGLVILAGGTQPLHWAAVRQVRYLASLAPAQQAASQPVIDTITRQAQAVDDPGLSPDTPASELPFAVPAPYWLDLRGYDPAAAAAALGKPVLVLQGGRDYQSTVAEDLAGWRAGLAGRPGVTIRVYEDYNHLFAPGAGPSAPPEYQTARHVDPAVVADIADWLMTTTAGSLAADDGSHEG